MPRAGSSRYRAAAHGVGDHSRSRRSPHGGPGLRSGSPAASGHLAGQRVSHPGYARGTGSDREDLSPGLGGEIRSADWQASPPGVHALRGDHRPRGQAFRRVGPAERPQVRLRDSRLPHSFSWYLCGLSPKVDAQPGTGRATGTCSTERAGHTIGRFRQKKETRTMKPWFKRISKGGGYD